MPEMSGLELMRQFVVKFTYLPIIIITGHGDVEMAVDAMKLGAFDFIEKPFKNQPLLDLVQKAIKEALRISKHHKQKTEIQLQLAALTEREHDVLEQILAGKINKMIGQKLGISEKTVEVHRANVMRKMQADSLTHLIKMCLTTDQYGLHKSINH
jgi:FixJ family two-component response regulator